MTTSEMPSSREPFWPFATAWDQQLASSGPGTIFTLDPKGLLRADAERTREIGLTHGALSNEGPHHFLVTDRATGVKMYLFVTHRALAEQQPKADAMEVETSKIAIDAVRAQWQA